MSITWGMKPEIIIGMLQATCRHVNDMTSTKVEKHKISNADVVKALKSPKKNSTR